MLRSLAPAHATVRRPYAAPILHLLIYVVLPAVPPTYVDLRRHPMWTSRCVICQWTLQTGVVASQYVGLLLVYVWILRLFHRLRPPGVGLLRLAKG